MTNTEKLNAIADKCRANLSLAEKRTPGEWMRAGELATHITSRFSRNRGNLICDLPDTSPDCDQYAPNAAYIAACSGAAEAGWRTTLLAIAALADMCDGDEDVISANIISAWEGLL